MEIREIPCNLIVFPKPNKEERTFSKDFAGSLANAIRQEGQLVSILVIPNPEKPGYFIGVDGNHRLVAISKFLKRETIKATVLEGVDEDDAGIIRISANLWRNPLEKSQRLVSIQKWWDHYKNKNPDKVGRGNAGSAAAAKKREEAKQQADEGQQAEAAPESEATEGPKCIVHLGPEGQGAEAAEPSKEPANFPELVAATTGVSIDKAKRLAKLARTFNADQLEVLEQMQVSQTDMLTIAKIKDDADRGAVVNLVASGMEPAEATREVLKDAAPKPANGAEKPKKEPGESDLSDDEWFATYCGKKAEMLAEDRREGYRGQALLFRRCCDKRHAFRTGIKKHLEEAKKKGLIGALYAAFNRAISISHPKDWLLCGDCRGTGKDDKGHKCQGAGCLGNGFIVKTETLI